MELDISDVGCIFTPMTGYTDIEQAALSLSREQRERLVSSLQYANRTKRASEDLSPLQRCVAAALSRHCRGTSEQAAIDMIGVGKFRIMCEDLRQFAEAGSSGELHETQLRGLIEMCIRCLAEELRARRWAVTPRAFAESMARLGDAVDACFPGYANAGLLHRLVARVDSAA
jgi:hypothetical protein